MSDITVENDEPPIGQATIVYLGPAAAPLGNPAGVRRTRRHGFVP